MIDLQQRDPYMLSTLLSKLNTIPGQGKSALRPSKCNASGLFDDSVQYVVPKGVKTAAHEAGFAMLHVDTGRVHLCQGVAATMWRGVTEGKTLNGIAAAVADTYFISQQSALENVHRFIDDLVSRKLVVPERKRSSKVSQRWLTLRALRGLFEYDIRANIFGFGMAHANLDKQACDFSVREDLRKQLIDQVVRAVSLASSFYWHPVLCLHGSMVIARLLRQLGIAAELVIGYRMAPFFSHAWVEVNGRVVNDSSALPQRLIILHRV